MKMLGSVALYTPGMLTVWPGESEPEPETLI
jgi:hypothetical protein